MKVTEYFCTTDEDYKKTVELVCKFFETRRVPFSIIDDYAPMPFPYIRERFLEGVHYTGKPFKECFPVTMITYDVVLIDEKDYTYQCLQLDAKREYKYWSQETCGKEYRAWLAERAQFYNNGFYESYKKLPKGSCNPTVEAVSERLRKL
jgi:hypothetical protein